MTELPLLVQTVVVLCRKQVRRDILWLIPERGVSCLKATSTKTSADMFFEEILALAFFAYGCVHRPTGSNIICPLTLMILSPP